MQQIKEIPLNGVSTTPSDYASTDGDLAFTSGLSNTFGSWQPQPNAKVVQSIPDGYRLVYIHHGATGYINGIFLHDGSLYFVPMNDDNTFVEPIVWTALNIEFDIENNKIVSLGNVLTILTDEPVKHFIWSDGAYMEYYTPEDLNIRFGLRGTFEGIVSESVTLSQRGVDNQFYNRLYKYLVKEFTNSNTSTQSAYTLTYDLNDANIPLGAFYAVDLEYYASTAGHYSVTIHITDGDGSLSLGTLLVTDIYASVGNGKTRAFTTEPMKAHNTYRVLTVTIVNESSPNDWGFAVTNLKILRTKATSLERLKESESVAKYKTSVEELLLRCKSQNRFVEPFFIRYGYELADGSISYASAPMLMIPNTQLYSRIGGGSNILVYTSLISADIIMRVPTFSESLRTQNVVKNIVIAVSPPLQTYDLDKEEYDFVKLDIGEEPFGYFAYMQDGTYSESTILNTTISKRMRASIDNKRPIEADTDNFSVNPNSLVVDFSVGEDVLKKRLEIITSTFRIIKKIPIGDLASGDYVLELDEGKLLALDSLPVMDISDVSTGSVVAKDAFVYNGRLNLVNVTQRYFSGWNPTNLMNVADRSFVTPKTYYAAKLSASFDGRNYDAVIPIGKYCELSLCWFYTPIPAKEITLYKIVVKEGSMVLSTHNYRQETEIYSCVIAPEEHMTMSGSYYFNSSFGEPNFTLLGKVVASNQADAFPNNKDAIQAIAPYIIDGMETVLTYGNKLLLSNIDNPIVTNLANSMFVGNGKILALATANVPISEGQFGQYPLYAFTTHGVWALEVKDDGTYGAPKPATRDVLTNINSITQIDDSVVFVSKRGLMLLNGGQSQCLSDNIDDTTVIHVPTAALTGSDIDVTINPKALLQGCSIIYDYPNQRLICYNSEEINGNKAHPYALVFSLKNQQWSYIINDMQYSINSYPDALVIDDNGSMLDMTNTNVGMHTPFIIYTRPFRISEDDYKTVNELRINGVFAYNHIRCILQASNDLLDWQSVASSETNTIQNRAGTPYRFFRLVLAGSLASYESISSFTVKFTPKIDANVIGH